MQTQESEVVIFMELISDPVDPLFLQLWYKKNLTSNRGKIQYMASQCAFVVIRSSQLNVFAPLVPWV